RVPDNRSPAPGIHSKASKGSKRPDKMGVYWALIVGASLGFGGLAFGISSASGTGLTLRASTFLRPVLVTPLGWGEASRMNRVYIKTYGCQMNERDSEAVAAMLRGRGYRIVNDEDNCDILLLNTCSVRDAAEQKALGKAGYLAQRKKHNPQFVLGILGCMAQNRGAAILEQLPDVDLIIGTQKFHQVPGYLDNLRAARDAGLPIGQSIVDVGEEEGSQNTIRDHLESPERQVTAFVSIQQGCNMDCAFCIVPRTRGEERARPMDDIVAECRALAERGVREVTLLGQSVTSYGRRDYPHSDGISPC